MTIPKMTSRMRVFRPQFPPSIDPEQEEMRRFDEKFRELWRLAKLEHPAVLIASYAHSDALLRIDAGVELVIEFNRKIVEKSEDPRSDYSLAEEIVLEVYDDRFLVFAVDAQGNVIEE